MSSTTISLLDRIFGPAQQDLEPAQASHQQHLQLAIAHHKKLSVDVGQQKNDLGERLRRLLHAMAFNRLEPHTLLSDLQTEKRVAVR